MGFFDDIVQKEKAEADYQKKFESLKSAERAFNKELISLRDKYYKSPQYKNKEKEMTENLITGFNKFFESKGFKIKVEQHFNFKEIKAEAGNFEAILNVNAESNDIDITFRGICRYSVIIQEPNENEVEVRYMGKMNEDGTITYYGGNSAKDTVEFVEKQIENLRYDIENMKAKVNDLENLKLIYKLYDINGEFYNTDDLFKFIESDIERIYKNR
ncbi:hypothetical protein P4S83_07555 [Aneurinibacillus thermoaerophilus]|uniref:hypothetical protein n=1 Tax=Aneurinibacillus thermoaerophilus TaxID=143495 RepID=UPI002E1E3BFB|nr:hypothetical protein [Aneurinibacillus thermoaerophilus]MED0765975.1 hypothetical protein [Aneurinibacillus thermoaerophilus]